MISARMIADHLCPTIVNNETLFVHQRAAKLSLPKNDLLISGVQLASILQSKILFRCPRSSHMNSKLFSITVMGALLLVSVSACSAVKAHHQAFFGHSHHAATADNQDPISGEWNVTFYVHEHKTPASFTFKVEGTTVTGTAYSDHTGPGTIRDGKYADGKLSFTLDFKKHESIVVTGALKEGKLSGDFSTEGFTDKWEATKK